MTVLEYRYYIDGEGVIFTACNRDAAPVGYVNIRKFLSSSSVGPFVGVERDMIRVMAAVLSVDRLSLRRDLGRKVSRMLAWQRSISLTIEVEDADQWNALAVLFVKLLTFMTDDDWEVTFTHSRCSVLQQLHLSGDRWQVEEVDEVALFSGGLDSAAGLLARSLECSKSMVAVSACGSSFRSCAQHNAMRCLYGFGVKARWIKIEHQLQRTRRTRRHLEVSQRSRSLLFLAMGAVVASRFGLPSFSVYETGIGCVNLPLLRAQTGSQNTRALHPRTLMMFGRLASQILARPMRVDTPFFLMTKGQLCQKGGGALASLVAQVSSCDEGERNKVNPMEHCGLCTSCLFRRVAVFSALGESDPTRYRDKITAQHDGYELKVLEGHIADIVEKVQDFDGLISLDPDARFALQYLGESCEHDAEGRVVEMYRRYADETSTFLKNARPDISGRLRRPLKDISYDLFATTR